MKNSRFGLIMAPASAHYTTAKSGLWRQVEHLKRASSTVDYATTSRRVASLPSKIYHPLSYKPKKITIYFTFFHCLSPIKVYKLQFFHAFIGQRNKFYRSWFSRFPVSNYDSASIQIRIAYLLFLWSK